MEKQLEQKQTSPLYMYINMLAYAHMYLNTACRTVAHFHKNICTYITSIKSCSRFYYCPSTTLRAANAIFIKSQWIVLNVISYCALCVCVRLQFPCGKMQIIIKIKSATTKAERFKAKEKAQTGNAKLLISNKDQKPSHFKPILTEC